MPPRASSSERSSRREYAKSDDKNRQKRAFLVLHGSLIRKKRIGLATMQSQGMGPGLKRVALVGMFVPANHRVIQPGAIGEDDMIQAADRIACLRGKDVNGDYVPGRERGFGPTDRPYCRRGSRFAYPVHDAALVILYVKVNQAVGI